MLLVFVFLAAIFLRNRPMPPPVPSKEGNSREGWEREIVREVEGRGAAAGLRLVAERSQKDSQYHAACHELMHIVGRETYSLYRKGGKISFTKDAARCAFGAYHGLMDAWVGKGEDAGEAVAFCDMIDRGLGKEVKNNYFQCWHGIGHGAVVPHDKRLWGNMTETASPALRLCQRLTTTTDSQQNCFRGVYGGLAIFLMDGEYGFSLETPDPFAFCAAQPQNQQPMCVSEMVPAVFKKNSHDIVETWRKLTRFSDSTILRFAASSLGGNAAVEQVPESTVLAECAKLETPYEAACKEGFNTRWL